MSRAQFHFLDAVVKCSAIADKWTKIGTIRAVLVATLRLWELKLKILELKNLKYLFFH